VVKTVNVTHGYGASSIYEIWCGMKKRCLNPRSDQYRNYGKRGITVCEEWANDFTAFLRDVGERPPGMTLERIDNGGNYEPGNVRWATPAEQTCNTRRTIRVRVKGREMALKEACAALGLPYERTRVALHAGATFAGVERV
jgi:hypothetical protein